MARSTDRPSPATRPRPCVRRATASALAASTLALCAASHAQEPPSLPPVASAIAAAIASSSPAPSAAETAVPARQPSVRPSSPAAPPPAPDPPASEPSTDLKAESRRADRKRAVETFMIVVGNTFFWPYLVSAIVGAAAIKCFACKDDNHFGWLILPVIGPFMTNVFSKNLDDAGRGVLIADGILQSASFVALGIAGTIYKRADQAPSVARGPWVRVVPGPGAGIGVVGAF